MKHLATLLYTLTLLLIAPAQARIVRDEEEDTSLIKSKKTVVAAKSAPAAEQEPQEKPKKHVREEKTTSKHKSRSKTKKGEESAATPQPVQAATSTQASPTDDIDAKIKALKEQAEQEMASLQTKTEQKVAILKHQEALKRINEQQQALNDELAKLQATAGQTKMQETPAAHEDAKDHVSTQWKIEQTAKFNRLSTELSDTVSAGESEEGELNEFAEIFEEQRAWFDSTMTNTRKVGDDNYNAIIDRNQRLSLLVTAQKKALPLLNKELNTKKVAKRDYDRAATILLYDLNAQLTDPEGWNGKLPEDDVEFIALVKTAVKESRDPSFAKASPSQKTLHDLQKKLHSTQKLIEDRNKKVLELELSIAHNQDKLTRLTSDITTATAAKKTSEEQLKQLQDKSTKDISALKVEKTTIESELSQAKTEAKEVKSKLESATTDITKTTQEKTELQTQAKDLAKKIDELQDKKTGVEKALDEEQHKRRELEIQVEQIKFKQEQAEKDSKKLEAENTKLERIKKELADQVDSKNRHSVELSLELERLRRELNHQNETGMKQAANIIASMKKDFEQEIHELKMMMLKKDNPSPSELAKEEEAFKAEQEQEAEALKKAIEMMGTLANAPRPASSNDAVLPEKNITQPTNVLDMPETKDVPAPQEPAKPSTLAESNKQAISIIERKNLEAQNKKALKDIEEQANTYLKKRGLNI